MAALNALRAFEAAARNLSFSRAGDELHVTHAAISHQIKNLERWFDCALFHREGRGVRLTRAGQTLFGRSNEMFEDLAELCLRVKAFGRQQSLAVGCIASIASRWLVPRLAEFSKAHPEIDIQVLYARSHERLSNGDYDVLITLGGDGSSDTTCEKLFSGVNKPVCSPHFLARHGPLGSAAEIAEAALLHDETRQAWQDWFTLAGLAKKGARPGPVFQDFNLLATAAVAGHGVALCPVEVFREEMRRGDLITVSDLETNADRSYFVITRRHSSPAAGAFVHWFFESVQHRAAS